MDFSLLISPIILLTVLSLFAVHATKSWYGLLILPLSFVGYVIFTPLVIDGFKTFF